MDNNGSAWACYADPLPVTGNNLPGPKEGHMSTPKGGTLCPRKGLKEGQYEPGCVLFVAERHGHRRVRAWQSMGGRGEVGDMLKWEGEDMVIIGLGST